MKTIANKGSVEKFINSIEGEEKREDSRTLVKIMEEISGKPATMWGPSIIGFDQYHYKYESGREGDFLVIGFSPRKQNLSIYIMPGYQDFSHLLKKLGPHKTGKSCLYIKRLSEIDLNVLKQIIQKGYDDMKKIYP